MPEASGRKIPEGATICFPLGDIVLPFSDTLQLGSDPSLRDMREVVRASAFAGLSELVAQLGGDLKQIAAEAHVPMPNFERPDEFISSRNLNLLLAAAATKTGHPDL